MLSALLSNSQLLIVGGGFAAFAAALLYVRITSYNRGRADERSSINRQNELARQQLDAFTQGASDIYHRANDPDRLQHNNKYQRD